MGCVLSYFRHGTLTLPEGQLTDKLLEGDVTEERPAETAGRKRGAAAATPLNGNTRTAEGDQSQDDASDEPSDDDKALLLGALGATAAGAVTVGAVAGALKTTQDRGETRTTDQDQSEPPAERAEDREETAKATKDQEETPSTVQDRTESPAAVPGTESPASPVTSDEPPGVGGAATAAAVLIGTSGVVTAAALTGTALQSDDDTTAAAANSDLPQRSDLEQGPPENRDHTPVQSEPAVSVSPDDSVFDDKQPQSQQESTTVRQESPAVRQQSPTGRQQSPALVADADCSISAEPETRPVSGTSGRESLSARLPEPPSRSPHSDKEDNPSHASSPVVESPVQTATEQDDARIHTPGEESIVPPITDKDDVTAKPPVEVSSDQFKVDDQVKKTLTPVTTADESPVQSDLEDSRVQVSASVGHKEATAPAGEAGHHMQSPTEWESVIQPTDVEKQSDVQAPAAEDESYIPSTIPIEDSSDPSKNIEDGAHVQFPTEQENAQTLTKEESPGTITDHSDVDSAAQSGHIEKDDQPVASDAVSMTASVGTGEQETPKKDEAREEVDTPQIVPAKKLSQQPTPEYEKFMSILVSPKGGRQASVEQAGVEDSKQAESTEQGQVPSKIDSDAKSEDPSSVLQKHEDEVESRAESSADAVCGSTTDLQEKIDSVQSPVPSVNEEPIVKVDRFSIGSEDAGSASASSREGSGPDDVNAGAVPSPSAIQDDNNVDDSQLDAASAPYETELPRDISEKKPESDAGNAKVGSPRHVPSGAGYSEDVLERDPSPGAIPDKNESQGLQSDLDFAVAAGLRDPTTSTELVEETDMAHDVSERTEDYDFDPLARTQSFIFPDDLAGRSSQLSEKPSSPFPELDESDIRAASATPSSTETKQAMDDEDKATQDANVTAPEETRSPSDANITPTETEKTTLLEAKVASEEASKTPAADATTSEADESCHDLPSEKAQTSRVAEPVTPEAGKGADQTENETGKSGLAAQQPEQVNAEETVPADPSQSAAAEEVDDSQQNSEQTEQPAPKVEEAATRIQAGVRGWQTRRKISRQQEAATQIQAGFRGWRVRHGRRMRRTSSLPVLSKTAPSDFQYMDVDTLKDRAAAKIQAGFRGWRTRQDMRSLAATSPLEEALRVSPAISMAEIGAEEQAAARIQAGYRGWKTRRTLRRSLSDPNSEALVLAESQQQKRVAESGTGASGPQPAAVNDRLTTSVEAATPRDEDETAHSIQSIQSEIASSVGSPRQDDNILTTTPPATEPASAAQPVDELSKVDPSATDSSTMEPSVDSPSVGDPSTADPSSAPLSSADENQQAEAAAKIQAGYRGWKTRQQMLTDPADADAETAAVRPTVSAKSVTDSGALPIDFAIVHRPEDDWLTQDLMKIEAEKRAVGGETAPEPKTVEKLPKTDEKLVASANDEPDGKEGKDARPDSASTTGSSSSWLTHAQTEIRASFQGLRDNVSDALKTVEDTARLVREKGAAAGAEGGAVEVTENTQRVTESGAAAAQPVSEGRQGSSSQAKEALEALKPDGQTGMDVNDVKTSEKSPAVREEEEIWEEIQRSMRHED